MKLFAAVTIAILGLAAHTMAEETNESMKPFVKRDIGCADEGSSSKPAWCYSSSCPSGYRSVFYDYGCPDGWKCCI